MSNNLELVKLHSKQDKLREYEDLILSNTGDIDPKKLQKMEEAIEKAKGLLDDKTEEIIDNEDIIPSDEEIKRENEEMEDILKDDELNNEVKELADEVEGFSLENSRLFNMINITQEDMFILILLILALFFRKEIISFMKKKM